MFQLPKVQQDVIKKILDVKEVKSRWGTDKQFLVKWFSKPASESTWMAEEGLKKAEPELHDESMKVFSPESSFPIRGDWRKGFWIIKKISFVSYLVILLFLFSLGMLMLVGFYISYITFNKDFFSYED
jgi:hypothetical protein